MLHIVLVHPEIPNNTGNIVRTCAAAGAQLHVIEPCGFSWEDKYLKRSGLDYWEIADVRRYDGEQAFLQANFPDAAHPEDFALAMRDVRQRGLAQCWYATTKANHVHTQVAYGEDCWMFFGRETRGLDEDLLAANYPACVRIPMRAQARSLNLGNSVAIMVYEYLRQHDYAGLREDGALRTGTPQQD